MAARGRDREKGLAVARLMLAQFLVALGQTVAGAVVRPPPARGAHEAR